MTSAVTTIEEAELRYPGGLLRGHQTLASEHVVRVAIWLARAGEAAAVAGHRPPPRYAADALARSVVLSDAAALRAAHGGVLLRERAGVVVPPEKKVLIDLDYALFSPTGLTHHAIAITARPLNPLVV